MLLVGTFVDSHTCGLFKKHIASTHPRNFGKEAQDRQLLMFLSLSNPARLGPRCKTEKLMPERRVRKGIEMAWEGEVKPFLMASHSLLFI